MNAAVDLGDGPLRMCCKQPTTLEEDSWAHLEEEVVSGCQVEVLVLVGEEAEGLVARFLLEIAVSWSRTSVGACSQR